jgi:hypothetical protein
LPPRDAGLRYRFQRCNRVLILELQSVYPPPLEIP